MRVLHVIDPGSPGGGACTLQLLSEPLARLNSVDQDVMLIGTSRHEALAARCGVEIAGRISPPCNLPVLAGFRGDCFKRFVHIYEQAAGPYDIIHTWTARSALLAAMSVPHHKRLGTLAVGPVNGILMQALANRLERHPATLLATSVSVKRDYLAMGLNEEHLEVLRPAVHPEAMEDHARSRDEQRAVWEVPDDSFVIGLLAEPVNWCDARRAMTVVALAIESGRDIRLVVHPAAQRRNEALAWATKLNLRDAAIIEDDLAEPWKCVTGLDAAMMIGDDSNTLDLRESGAAFAVLTGGGRRVRPMTGVMPALWAMAAGVPVVAESSLAMQEIIDDGTTGFLVNQRDINAIASCMVQLYDDRSIGRRVGAAARQHVHQKHHVSSFTVLLREMYERLHLGRLAKVVGDGSEVVEKRPFADMRR